MSTCPSEKTLARLGHDSLDGAEWTAVEAHVQHCEECMGLMEKLLAHDTATATSTATVPATASASLPSEENLPHIAGFDIQAELGRGGMGVVYRAWEPKLARTVALKIVPSGPKTGSRERKRWLSEARCVTRVCHPKIVQIHDAGEADGWLYLVLEFVPGGSLKERLRGPVPPRAAAELMRQVAAAITAVHTAGMLHLDLKPSNILLDSAPEATWQDASPKVADFGIARPLADLDASSTSLAGPWGTPSYMAPEQTTASRAQIGPATDVYALGAVMYELLTGRPPFQGTSTLETLDQVRGQKPVPPRRLNPKIPRDLETIALKCLEKNPSRRYASAEALADDLRRWLEGRSISARPVSFLEKTWSGCRHRPVVAGLVATLALTLSTSFFGILLLWRYAEAERVRAESERGHAQSERLRAEADYKITRDTLAEVLDLGGNAARSNNMSRDQLISCLKGSRARMLELAQAVSNDPEIRRLLALTDLYLARNLELEQKLEEAYPLNLESLMYWETILRMDPLDKAARYYQWETFTNAARVTERLGRIEESIGLWERSLVVGEDVLPGMTIPDYCGLANCRIAFARCLRDAGHPKRAKTVLEANLSMLGNMRAKEMNPTIQLALSQTWYELGWNMLRSEPLSEKEWSREFALFLESTIHASASNPCQEAEAGYMWVETGTATAAYQRRTGKLDDARRVAVGMYSFSLSLVERHPDQPAAHLALGEAYSQLYKNAWRVNDRATVERNLRLAVDATQRALVLDPNNEIARRAMDSRQSKLKDLVDPP